MATDAINKTYDIKKDDLQHALQAAVHGHFFKSVYEKKLSDITKGTKLPGFRPGKVPKSLLDKRYGPALIQETTEEVVQQSLTQILEKEQLKMAAQPKVDIKPIKLGSDVEYTAEFESLPVIDAIDFKKLSLQKAVVDLSEQECEQLADEAIKQSPEWQTIKKAASKGDQVTIDYVGKIDDTAFEGGSAEKAEIVLGEGRFIEDLETGIIGMKADETKAIEVTFPATYHAEHLAGKAAVFTIVLHDVKKAQYAKLDKAWFEKSGSKATTKKEFLEEIKVQKQPMADQTAKRLTHKRLSDALIAHVDCSVPQSLVKAELGGDKAGEPDKASKEKAESRVKYSLVVQQLAESFKTQVTNADIEQFIESIVPPGIDKKLFMSWYAQDKNQLQKVKIAVLENKVLDHALDLCQLKEEKMTLESAKSELNKES